MLLIVIVLLFLALLLLLKVEEAGSFVCELTHVSKTRFSPCLLRVFFLIQSELQVFSYSCSHPVTLLMSQLTVKARR